MKLGMTVQRLRGDVSSGEFMRWQMYYARIAQHDELRQRQVGTGG